MVKKKSKVPKKKKDLFERLEFSMRKLSRNMEKSRVDEYVGLVKRPWKILGFNFAIGVVRGFGIAVGMTIVVALVMYMVSKMVNLPIIGKFIAQIVDIVNSYLTEGPRFK